MNYRKNLTTRREKAAYDRYGTKNPFMARVAFGNARSSFFRDYPHVSGRNKNPLQQTATH